MAKLGFVVKDMFYDSYFLFIVFELLIVEISICPIALIQLYLADCQKAKRASVCQKIYEREIYNGEYNAVNHQLPSIECLSFLFSKDSANKQR